MVAGDPGIGKTRLTEEIAELAGRKGFEVHWGRSFEDTGAPPFWPWNQILRSYSSPRAHEEIIEMMGASAEIISDIFPDINAWAPDLAPPPVVDDPESARFRLFDSASNFLVAASASQPLMLVLDDVHWADAPTLQLLQFFARYVSESKIVVVGTYRDTELSRLHPLSGTLADLNRSRNYTRLLLRGLADTEIRNLVQELGSARATDEINAKIIEQTQGNPFFVKEIAYELANEVQIGRVMRIPEGVREVVGKRLNRISEAANDLLRSAAMIGLEFDYRVLHRLNTENSEDELIELIEEVIAAHLMESAETVGRFRFAHALVRQTLVDEINAVSQVRLHARIANEMESIYSDEADDHAAELAYHFAEADLTGDSEKVIHYSTIAGEHALSVHAPSQAAAHFETALNALPNTAPVEQRANLHYGLAKGYVQTLDRSELQRAADQLRLAFDAFVEDDDAEAAVSVALTRFPPVHGPIGLADMITRAIPLVEQNSLNHGLLLGVLIRWVDFEGRGDPARATGLLHQATQIAHELGDEKLHLWILIHSTGVELAEEPQSIELMESDRIDRAIALAEKLGDDNSEYVGKEGRMDGLLGSGEYDRAFQMGTEALAAARRTRNGFNIATALSVMAGVRLVRGEWDIADELLDEGLAINPDEIRVIMLKIMSLAERGEFEEAVEFVLRGNEILDRPGSWINIKVWNFLGASIVANLGGPNVLDLTQIETALENQAELMGPRFAPIVAGAGLATGNKELMNRAMKHQGSFEWPRRRGALRCPEQYLAPTLHILGKTDEAEASFEEGLKYCTKMGDTPGIVWLNTDYIKLLLDRNAPGDHPHAIALRDEAVALATQHGMKPHLGMLNELTRRIETATPPTGTSKGSVYPDNLSDREVEVLRLIAAGHSNQKIADELFLSRYTIIRHVSNIFAKTGCSNRTEAATYASRHNLTEEIPAE
jgi:DNA-binding CsgD family transcriptional regulator